MIYYIFYDTIGVILKKYILSVDFNMVLVVVWLMTLGVFTLTSATDNERRLTIQTICAFLGIILMIAVSFWDYTSVLGKKNHIYALCVFFLLIVFPFGTGKEETGAISWIRFAGIGIQPSEFVKLLFAIYLSCELTEKIEKNTLNNPKALSVFLLKCALIIALVILQNDTGTALVFLFMLITVLFVAGISLKYVLLAISVTLVLLPIIWLTLADYQRDRILVFFNPSADLSDSGYQVHLSKLALSSGGIWGKGYKNGAVNALSYLPEKETDFIFSVIGEEFGFLGTSFLIAMYLVLIFKMFSIISHTKITQGKILATAVCAMFIFHIIENISMSIGLLPVTGIPLPFISYGGSSMFSMSLGVGLVLSVRQKNIFYSIANRKETSHV